MTCSLKPGLVTRMRRSPRSTSTPSINGVVPAGSSSTNTEAPASLTMSRTALHERADGANHGNRFGALRVGDRRLPFVQVALYEPQDVHVVT